jgi:hypothetical protein
MSDVEQQALITLMDYTKSTAGSSKQHELFIDHRSADEDPE